MCGMQLPRFYTSAHAMDSVSLLEQQLRKVAPAGEDEGIVRSATNYQEDVNKSVILVNQAAAYPS